FKLQLGLPPRINLDLDVSPLKPMTEQLDRFQRVIDQYEAFKDLVSITPPEADTAKVRNAFKELIRTQPLTQGTPFREAIFPRWAIWEGKSDDDLTKALSALRAQRRKVLDQKAQLDKDQKPIPDALRKQQSDLEYDINL